MVRQVGGVGFGGKPAVIADQQRAGGLATFLQVCNDSAADQGHVVIGEIIGDDSTPAIGTELDSRILHRGHLTLMDALYTRM